MKTANGKFTKRWIALACAIVLMVVGTILNVSVTTNHGNVKVTRVTYSDDLGNIVSAQLYIPKTATSDTPAPAVLTNHGGGNSSEAQSSYNIELARRGFVVLSWDASNCGSSEESADETHGGEASYKFLQSLDYVDHTQLATSGHSMGGVYAYMVAQNHPENVKITIPVGMNPGMNDTSSFGTNYACIIGNKDESNLVRSDGNIINMANSSPYHELFQIPEDEIIEVNKVYGSFEDGTARIFYMPDSSHAGAMINHSLLEVYLDTIQTAITAPNPISGSDQIWAGKDFGMLLQFIGLVIFLFSLANILLTSKSFESLILPEREPVGYKEKSPMWYVSLLFLLFVPAIFFIPFSTIPQKINVSGFMKLDATANGISIWAILSSILLFAFFLFYHYTYGRKNNGCLMNYGLSTETAENKIRLSYILKALSFALIIIGGTYIAYMFMYEITSGDVHIWLATLRPVTFIRIKYIPLYLLLQAPFYFAGTIAGRSISLNNGERSKGHGMRNSLIISLLIGILGLFIIFLVFNIVFRTTGVVLFNQNRGYIYAGAIFAMLPSFAVGNTINCYVTNKTNSIYAGLFSGILWSTWVLVASNAIG